MLNREVERAEAKRDFLEEYHGDVSHPSLDAERVRLVHKRGALTKVVITRKIRTAKDTGEGTLPPAL